MKAHELYRRLNPLLRPLGRPYAGLMRVRRELYLRGALPAYTPRCPCISVGNVAFGGSGKTPVVEWLLRSAKQAGRRAVVLSRGYRANPGKTPLLVRADTPVERAGDEPLMLARAHPEASVLVFPRRAEAARFAERHLIPDLLILDDGMQHLALRRNMDLVLLRPEDLDEDWDRVIPSGPWREGASALSSASAFLIKAGEEEFAGLTPLVRERLSALPFFAESPRPVFSFSLAPAGLRPLFGAGGPAQGGGGSASASLPEELRDTPYVLISAVGNSRGVEAGAAAFMGRPPLQHFDFADHHPFNGGDVQAVLKLLPAPLPVICTAKDAVKLEAFGDLFARTPVWVLESEARFGAALFCDENFASWWKTRLHDFLF